VLSTGSQDSALLLGALCFFAGLVTGSALCSGHSYYGYRAGRLLELVVLLLLAVALWHWRFYLFRGSCVALGGSLCGFT
jgi:hypothetical protein